MKRLILFVCICALFSCKKEKVEDITKYNWVLKTQVVKPAITIDGKTSTNYLSLQNPDGCSKNFTISFHDNGVFSVGSNGSLCDMVANSNAQKWKKEGDQITLDYGNGPGAPLTLKENTLVATSTFPNNGATYSLTSIYVAVKSK
ncbi:hypothetical protein [Pedobacter boryungensis]|uniref:Lipocalin-like domain-containing protein n=1 Tax=Pedobacter boryungensis TaxID=869962 RepID=A0ABX2DCD7_9SPHI|nr:hypothetical protein [Pedobacter boryungensis]NQX31742.1 hypothetical protein [Pedobacter boryungensis]